MSPQSIDFAPSTHSTAHSSQALEHMNALSLQTHVTVKQRSKSASNSIIGVSAVIFKDGAKAIDAKELEIGSESRHNSTRTLLCVVHQHRSITACNSVDVLLYVHTWWKNLIHYMLYICFYLFVCFIFWFGQLGSVQYICAIHGYVSIAWTVKSVIFYHTLLHVSVYL